MPGTSAAWVLGIVSVVTGVIGSLLLTVIDPVIQAFFASPSWTSSTTYGSDLLGWLESSWALWPALILFGIMFLVWIETRQPA